MRLRKRVKNRKRPDSVERQLALKAVLERWLRRLVRVLVLVAALGAAGYGVHRGRLWALTSPTFALQRIAFEGLERVQAAELSRLAGLSIGQNIFELDTAQLARAMGTHPWVREVMAVERRYPASLTIKVQEQTAVALAALGDVYLVNPQGQPFKKVQAADPTDLPLVSGLSRDDYVADPDGSAQRFRAALAIAQEYAPYGKGEDALSELRLGSAGVILVTNRGEQVRLPELPTPEALLRLTRVRAELLRRGLSADVVHLDNRARPSWVTVKLSVPPSEKSGETAQ
jgi:cell division protein FtsQ